MDCYELLNQLKKEVSQNNGEAFVMKSSVDEDSKKIITERFNVARNEEYKGLMEQCDDFLRHHCDKVYAFNDRA